GTVSSINLRGLGSNETLVLIDGRRTAGLNLGTLVANGGSLGQPDINGIPLAAIERIEVLPSSASAIYGGAAVGGVVNIILKKNFDGGELSYTYDNPFSGHAPIQNVNGAYGFSLDNGRTQVTLRASYSDADPLLLKDRQSLFARGVSEILANDPPFLYTNANPFPGATTNIGSLTGVPLVLRNGVSLNSPITSIPAAAGPTTAISNALVANAGRYDLGLSPGTGPYGLDSPFGSVA